MMLSMDGGVHMRDVYAQQHTELMAYMQPAIPAPAAKQRGKDRCQVPGCSADLNAQPKLYCLKKRICMDHMQAQELSWPGMPQLQRYCFQCARVEPLANFDGTKRSCRMSLHRRKVRPSPPPSQARTSSGPITAAGQAMAQMHAQQAAMLAAAGAAAQGNSSAAAATAWLEPSGGMASSGAPLAGSLDSLLGADVWAATTPPYTRSASPADAAAAAAAAASLPTSGSAHHQLSLPQHYACSLQQQAQLAQLQLHHLQHQQQLAAQDAAAGAVVTPKAATSPCADRFSETASSASPTLSPMAAAAAAAGGRGFGMQPPSAWAPAPAPGRQQDQAGPALHKVQQQPQPEGPHASSQPASSAAAPAAAAAADPHADLFDLLTGVLRQPLLATAASTTADQAAAAPGQQEQQQQAGGAQAAPACSAAPAASSAPVAAPLPAAPAAGPLALRGQQPAGPSVSGGGAASGVDLQQTAAQLHCLERELTTMYSHLQALRQSFMQGRAAA